MALAALAEMPSTAAVPRVMVALGVPAPRLATVAPVARVEARRRRALPRATVAMAVRRGTSATEVPAVPVATGQMALLAPRLGATAATERLVELGATVAAVAPHLEMEEPAVQGALAAMVATGLRAPLVRVQPPGVRAATAVTELPVVPAVRGELRQERATRERTVREEPEATVAPGVPGAPVVMVLRVHQPEPQAAMPRRQATVGQVATVARAVLPAEPLAQTAAAETAELAAIPGQPEMAEPVPRAMSSHLMVGTVETAATRAMQAPEVRAAHRAAGEPVVRADRLGPAVS